MSKLKKITIIVLTLGLLSLTYTYQKLYRTTWYDTSKHPKVYRDHSTAAVSRNVISELKLKVGKKENNINGSLLIVTNVTNNKSDTVEVTDVCGSTNHVDLSLFSFEKISKKNVGVIKVKIKKL